MKTMEHFNIFYTTECFSVVYTIGKDRPDVWGLLFALLGPEVFEDG